jgi:ATP-binding cassette subfamily B (MDR/TAP) protein 1
MTLVMLGTAPLMGVAIAIQGKLTVTFTKKASDSSAHAVAVAEEVITNFRTVRSFAAEEKEVTRFEKALQSILNVGYAKAGAQGLSLGLVTACIWAAAALAFFYGAFQVEDGKITLGEVISVFGMMLFAVIGISQALNQLPEVFKTKASFAMIAEIVERTPEIPNKGGRRLDRINGQVDLSKLRFKYPTRDALVLNDLSLSVKPGQTVALVGESGSGKSTIFALVERFYDPEGGQVLIDGVDLRELDPKWYHRQVAIVSQEPILFSGSIKENIMYGKMDATDAEVVDAARAANAHDFITGLPNGYDTLVGERGIALSGGQKQRVAIARAVLKNPKILLLDEATSALDTESEALVQQALDKLMVGRTSFIIAHRLSTVRNADVIYVLSKGEVVEQGTHKGLIAKKGHYLKLATRQLARTDADDEDLDIVGSTSGAGVSSTDDDEEEKGKERSEPAL